MGSPKALIPSELVELLLEITHLNINDGLDP